jgi:hypothetical protein
MKTHDETKRALVTCTELVMPKEVQHQAMLDTLAYIQQLETANAELLTKVEQLETKCHQLERERDAAVACIPRACGFCKWFEINRGGNMTECHNPNGCRNISGVNTGFEWISVKEE